MNSLFSSVRNQTRLLLGGLALVGVGYGLLVSYQYRQWQAAQARYDRAVAHQALALAVGHAVALMADNPLPEAAQAVETAVTAYRQEIAASPGGQLATPWLAAVGTLTQQPWRTSQSRTTQAEDEAGIRTVTTVVEEVPNQAIVVAFGQIRRHWPVVRAHHEQAVQESRQRVEAQGRQLMNWFWGLIMLGFMAIGSAALLMVAYFLKPLRKVSSQLDLIAAGDLQQRVAEVRQQEIGQIARSVNQLVDSLCHVRDFIREIGKGNLQAQLTGTADGEVGQADALSHDLLHMQRQMQEAAQAEKNRNWATEGLAQFIDILRAQHQDLTQLAERIVAEVVQYVRANQGALYVAQTEHDHTVLQLMACYAYGRKKHRQHQLQPGEGLAGQAYLERDVIYLRDVPADYVRITSGLGEALPRNVLIVPLVLNEEIYGVLELASFQLFEPHEIEFLKKLGESVASTLSAAQVNQRTQHLLEESQMMTEQMRAQEEEMRQNMEELATAQEELSRKAHEMSAFTSSIDRSTVIIDFYGDGTVARVNDRFCQLTGYSREEIVGQPHTYYVPEDAIKSGAFEQLWADLERESYLERDVKRKRKDGSLFWLRAYYFPVRDEQGQLVRINCICSDITGEIEQHLALKKQQQHMEEAEQLMRSQLEGITTAYAQMESTLDDLRQRELALLTLWQAQHLPGAAIDQHFDLTFCNEAFQAWLGTAQPLLPGADLRPLLAPEVVKALEAALQGQHAAHGQVHCTPIRDAQQRILGATCHLAVSSTLTPSIGSVGRAADASSS